MEEDTISAASAIEQWAFFFLFADRYDSQRLRELLPGVEFQQAIAVVEAIAGKTEDRMMYDQLLGDQLTSDTVLRKLAIDELSTLLGELQQRLRSRES